ncbi:SPFH domain-containing protein [Curtobacterium sp. MCJR17_043]|uniref:SPFH domain-containing protein n=1 Tax=Curtobacterium sp. MCJR17_043 TaxID=2175660 RepID=UPI0024DFA237|nr:SPFH domain-containing protein [Curtobacterium sp. MCJR17_043]WIB35150.1 SPFH domain-containing protein [Curtobacterium sp. MCJR17_043]
MFVLAILFLVVALAALWFRTRTYTTPARPATPGREAQEAAPTRRPNRVAAWFAVGAGFLFAVCTLASTLYAQDTGESKVQVDISGNIVGQTTDSGFHFTAPWATLHTFNIRNQTVTYINAVNGSDSDNNGNVRSGPYVTVQDRDGVSSNISLNLQYSIDAKAVTDIYRSYKTEENFKTQFIGNSVRSVVRQVPNDFTTIALITKRGAVEKSMIQALERRWQGSGVHVDNFALQEITPPEVGHGLVRGRAAGTDPGDEGARAARRQEGPGAAAGRRGAGAGRREQGAQRPAAVGRRAEAAGDRGPEERR